MLDTGANSELLKRWLCKSGHKSFVDTPWDVDTHGHGTNVAGLIATQAGGDNFCLVILKILNDSGLQMYQIGNAVRHAHELGAVAINMSYVGTGVLPDEQAAMIAYLNSGGAIFAAAGNDRKNLTKNCNAFPACYDPRITVVMSGILGILHPFSNKLFAPNRKTAILNGVNQCFGGICLSGTSQATALATGNFIRKKLNN